MSETPPEVAAPKAEEQVVVPADDQSADTSASEPGEDLDQLAAGIEALVFSHGAPVAVKQLATALEVEVDAIRRAADTLEARLAAPGSGLRLARVAGGLQITTREEWRGTIERLLTPKREDYLSEAALETLSVIAYRQPITVPELNELRGVNSQSVVGTLTRHRLIQSRGRKKVVGRPLLYGTTKEFLHRLGLDRLEDLPQLRELADGDGG